MPNLPEMCLPVPAICASKGRAMKPLRKISTVLLSPAQQQLYCAKNLIGKFLVFDEAKRFGGEQFTAHTHVKTHAFCRDVEWGNILNLKKRPLYKPVTGRTGGARGGR